MTESLSAYLARQIEGGLPQELAMIVESLADASLLIADHIRLGIFDLDNNVRGKTNVQGEVQKKLDVLANEIILAACNKLEQVSYAVSEELEDAILNSDVGKYAVIFDPLDGSSNLDVNISVGSIFSIVEAREPSDLLQPGSAQRFAGYVAYGPTTMLVFTFGDHVAMFAVDEMRCLRLINEKVAVPEHFPEYSINASNRLNWPAPIARFVDDCDLGDRGPLQRNYNMRWVGSMVAELHRILLRGGVFLYPSPTSSFGGKLRLLYEANPMGLIFQVAGGLAWTGAEGILDIVPNELHQRTGVIIGSVAEVSQVKQYFLKH